MYQELVENDQLSLDFLEVAPENWMNAGPRHQHQLRELTERFPFSTHGLSLSIGSPVPLDIEFVQRVKAFLDEHQIDTYTEHLSFCSDEGHLYDLLPIPFTEQAVDYVSERIRRVSDVLERRIALENVSFYAMPPGEMSELDFINSVLEKADCDLLLDVNNVYVNSVNHGYDPLHFINQLPSERIRYLHIAGHYQQDSDLIIDTHGADVIDPVWELLKATYSRHGQRPTLLERDFNIPSLATLDNELSKIRQLKSQAAIAPAQTSLV
ncbi:hypothetical protein CWI81_08070 [Idiomarina seosinensis]|uniref:Uncharacterized protein n=2 Tax=Idiomarina seosinensis TaxID=281739 RepID=A0A432ZED5_9GAMM|nr:hypothetical protein CWI81_08070 [Idiomarina seosinensis]